jgi:RNA polymerase sigma-70 factor (ECF subfamily)
MTADAATPAPQEIDSLIERCLKGDQAAWENIVRLYWRKVFNIAYKFVGRHDEAEDLTQDVFLKLFKSIKTFDRRANFSTWLISVSRNLCIDHYRSVRREHDAVTHDIDVVTLAQPSTIESPLATLERRDRVALLRAALDKLAPSLRMAVMLRDIQELSYQEIADRLGVPEGTVKSRINRGRTELARQIARLREQQERARLNGARRATARNRTGVSG